MCSVPVHIVLVRGVNPPGLWVKARPSVVLTRLPPRSSAVTCGALAQSSRWPFFLLFLTLSWGVTKEMNMNEGKPVKTKSN